MAVKTTNTIPRGSLAAMQMEPLENPVWHGDVRHFLEIGGERDLNNALHFLFDVREFVSLQLGYRVLQVHKDYNSDTSVVIAPLTKSGGTLLQAVYAMSLPKWGDFQLSVYTTTETDAWDNFVFNCYAPPPLPETWNVPDFLPEDRSAVYLADAIYALLRRAHAELSRGGKTAFLDEIQEALSRAGERHPLFQKTSAPLGDLIWSLPHFLNAIDLPFVQRKEWRYLKEEDRIVKKSIRGKPRELQNALKSAKNTRSQNSILSELADLGQVPEDWVRPEAAGRPRGLPLKSVPVQTSLF